MYVKYRGFYIFLIILLACTTFPIFKVDSANKAPIIQMLAINGQNRPTVFVDTGQVSYASVVQSFSENQKALVSLTLRNTESNENTVIFADQWLESMANTGFFNVDKGTYVVTLTAKDENGVSAEPYSITIIAGSEVDMRLASIEPNMVTINADREIHEVTVTVENRSPTQKETKVGWRWEGDLSWQGIKEVTIPGMYNAGKESVTFSIMMDMQNQTERTIEFMVNPDREMIESDYQNNSGTLLVTYDLPDLSVGYHLADYTDTEMTLIFPVLQVDIPGRTDTIVTSLEYGLGNKRANEHTVVGNIPNISLGVGEEKEYTVTLPIRPVAYAHVNPTASNPNKERDDDNNIVVTSFNFNNEINLFVRFGDKDSNTYRQGETVTTVVKAGKTSKGVLMEPVEVVLRLDGKEIGRESIHINSGEERLIPFTWKVPATGSLKPTSLKLEVEINPMPRTVEEVTYDDNIDRMSVTVLPEEVTGAVCKRGATQTSAVSGQYEYWCNCNAGVCQVCVANYFESVDLKQTQPDPKTLKAGMGFSATFDTRYYNDNPHNGKKHDFQSLTAEFDDEDKRLPDVQLVPQEQPPPSQSENKWKFPRAKIYRGQGDIEMIEYLHTSEELRVGPDEAVDGGNKYYTSFYQQDKAYSYAINGEGAGVREITYTNIKGETSIVRTVEPRLSICVENTYTIEGSPHDDYIIRRVDPNIPFPQNGLHGWDWNGQEYVFDDLAPWWNTYGRENPGRVDEQEWIVDLRD